MRPPAGRRLSGKAATIVGSLLLLALSSCVAENNQVGLLLTSNNEVEFLYVRCLERPEVIREIHVSNGDGDIIWEIVDERPVSQAADQPEVLRFLVGETPLGFETTIPLQAPLTEESDYSLAVDGLNQEGFPYVLFTLEALDEETVFGPVEAPVDKFIEKASEECIPSRPTSRFQLVFAFVMFGLALVGLATIGKRVSEITAARRERKESSRKK